MLYEVLFLLYMSYFCFMFYYIFVTCLYVYYMFLNLFQISIFTLFDTTLLFSLYNSYYNKKFLLG